LLDVWSEPGTGVFAVGFTGTILRYDGVNWKAMSSGTTQLLRGVWAAGADDVFAVGDGGTILHYDGIQWMPIASGVSFHLTAVWGTSGANVFAVGYSDTLLHYDGVSWTPMDSGESDWLTAVWGAAPDDVYATQEYGAIVHYDGSFWSRVYSGPHIFEEICGRSGTDVYATGLGGRIVHFDGSTWSELPRATTEMLWGMSLPASGPGYAVGAYGTILRHDGVSWSSMNAGIVSHIKDVWGTSGSDVYAVSGRMYHYDGFVWTEISPRLTQNTLAVWGSLACDVWAAGLGGTILRYFDPGPVSLAFNAVEAVSTALGIEIRWAVVADEGIDGFRLYRTELEGGAGTPLDRGLEVCVNPEGLITGDKRKFTDTTIQPGTRYRYAVVAVSPGGSETRSHSVEVTAAMPAIVLRQNQPNPFNPSTRIVFSLDRASNAKLAVYDPAGRLVRILADRPMEPGLHEENWDGTDTGGRRAASGIYFYRLTVGGRTLTKKMLLLK
jgi:hypothetical protein